MSQCTLVGPVYIRMPLECHWLTQYTLGYLWKTQRILVGYTGTPLGKLSWNYPHWNATEESLTIAATLEHNWRGYDSPHTQAHIVKQTSSHASLKWQDVWTSSSKWRDLCKFSFYLEFTALQCIPVLFFKRVSTSTSLHVCFWYERIIVFVYLELQFKWNPSSSNNSRHTNFNR